jgi:hypothetical protein
LAVITKIWMKYKSGFCLKKDGFKWVGVQLQSCRSYQTLKDFVGNVIFIRDYKKSHESKTIWDKV